MNTDALPAESRNVSIYPCTRRRFVRAFCWIAVSTPFLSHRSLFLAEIHAQPASDIGIFRMNLNSFPALRNTYGSVRLLVTGMPTSFPQIIVTRVPNDVFFAVTSRCTHGGCTVGTYSTSTSAMTCPCHGARFLPDGTVVRGPANEPLTQYVVQYEVPDFLSIEIPGLGFQITGAIVLVGENNVPRYRLSFPTVSGVNYEVCFRESLAAGAWARIPFSTTPTGAATSTVHSGDGAPATVYVDRDASTGFYAVARL
jgi:nitrite reductase/ring-hydroxylating ferredoxin subunit